eukprot:1161701-Pelagomonas_calceolata.AAC.3
MATSRALGLGLLALVALSGECGLSCFPRTWGEADLRIMLLRVRVSVGRRLCPCAEHEINRYSSLLAVGLLVHSSEWLRKLRLLLEIPVIIITCTMLAT